MNAFIMADAAKCIGLRRRASAKPGLCFGLFFCVYTADSGHQRRRLYHGGRLPSMRRRSLCECLSNSRHSS